jgi:aquaporin SIP
MQIFVGAEYTGPSMNPAITFSWFWHMGGHDSYEHAAVFWAAPLIGGAVAGLLWAWAMGPTVPSNGKSGSTTRCLHLRPLQHPNRQS